MTYELYGYTWYIGFNGAYWYANSVERGFTADTEKELYQKIDRYVLSRI